MFCPSGSRLVVIPLYHLSLNHNCLNLIIFIDPKSPPTNLSTPAINSTSLTLSWGPPDEPDGVITEYKLQCSERGEMFNWTVMGSQTTTTLSGLLPYTNYTCSITAHTSVGGGPAATTSVVTDEESKRTCCKLTGLN